MYNFSEQMQEYGLFVFPSLCEKQQTLDTILIKDEEDIVAGMLSVGE